MRLADVIASAQILSIAFIAGKRTDFCRKFSTRVVAKIRPFICQKGQIHHHIDRLPIVTPGE